MATATLTFELKATIIPAPGQHPKAAIEYLTDQLADYTAAPGGYMDQNVLDGYKEFVEFTDRTCTPGEVNRSVEDLNQLTFTLTYVIEGDSDYFGEIQQLISSQLGGDECGLVDDFGLNAWGGYDGARVYRAECVAHG